MHGGPADLSRPPSLMEPAVHGGGFPMDSTLWVACYNREPPVRTREAPRPTRSSEASRDRSCARSQALTTSRMLLEEYRAPIRS